MFLSMMKKLAFGAVLGLFTIAIASPAQANPTAMTWRSLSVPVVVNGKTYIYVGTDNVTNPYSGDTAISEVRSLLCIRKSADLTKNPIPKYAVPSITPGGATRNSWSGGQVFAIPNIVGKSLTSQAVADNLCYKEGLSAYGLAGFRMAEFHDGTVGWAGWDFWAQAASQFNGLSPHPNSSTVVPSANMRYWVRINSTNANPW